MSCNCTTPTYNCGNCGNTVPACTCSQTPILPPVYICPEPETCDEVFPLECVEYVGADIKCSATVDILHPSIEHYIVLEDGTRTDRRLPAILNNINSQLCYIFSKEYVSQVLTIIQADAELSALFCEIACSCNCGVTPPVGPTCYLPCPAHTITYSTGLWHTTITRVVDNPSYFAVTKYVVSWYKGDGVLYSYLGANTYNSPFGSSTITVNLSGAVNDTDDILVLVQMFTDNEVCTKGLPPADGYKAVDFLPNGAYYDNASVCWYKNTPASPVVCPTITNLTVT